MAAMSDTTRPAPTTARAPRLPPASDKVPCERCGAEMFRMHAVWRCPSCGFKTDCCGW
jgi:DNA-directed RNA polymerase subunit RPC12/RpoP